MSKAEAAINFFERYNCAQSVLCAYAEDFGMEKKEALSIAVGFGGGIGRTQETCGAVTGAVMVLGLLSDFKAEDDRKKINAVYTKVQRFLEEFAKVKGSTKCRDLIGCDLQSEEGQKYFKEKNLKEDCRAYIRLCCELLDKENNGTL